MDAKTILHEALQLRPAERLQLIEWLAQSLNKPDEKIDQIWAKEAKERYEALSAGKVNTISLDAVIQRYH